MIPAAIDAIRHGAEAGKLRAFVRENGGSKSANLAGLTQLAERHSRASGFSVCLLARGWTSTPGRGDRVSEGEF